MEMANEAEMLGKTLVEVKENRREDSNPSSSWQEGGSWSRGTDVGGGRAPLDLRPDAISERLLSAEGSHGAKTYTKANTEELTINVAKGWRWEETVSYWVGVTFMEGSVLFIVGAVGSLLGPEGWRLQGTVTFTYFAGGVLYTVGSLLYYIEVLNTGQSAEETPGTLTFSNVKLLPDVWHFQSWGSLAAIVYVVGALLFQVNVTAALWAKTLTLQTWSCILGAACFALGGFCEMEYNQWRSAQNWTLALGASVLNFCGGVLFLMGCLAGTQLCTGINGTSTCELVAGLGYALGCFCYVLSSAILVHMWDSEQFGLVVIAHLNTHDTICETKASRAHSFDVFARVVPSLRARRATEPTIFQQHLESQDAYEELDDRLSFEDAIPPLSPSTGESNHDLLWKEAGLFAYVLVGCASIFAICMDTAFSLHQASGADDGEDKHGSSESWLNALAIVLSSTAVIVVAHIALATATYVHRMPNRQPFQCAKLSVRMCLAMLGVSCVARIVWFYLVD